MTAQSALQRTPTGGVLNGFSNLLRRESRKWWGTNRWWIQFVIWFAILNGFVVFGLFVMPRLIEASAPELEQAAQSGAEVLTAEDFQRDVPNALFGLATFLLPVGVIVLVQSQVYSEKRSGVAAWILSKPVTRPAYLLAKFVSDLFGILVLMIVVQMIPAYLIISAVIDISLSSFLSATLMLALLLIFYQSFTLMMSVIGSSTEIVVGVSLGFLLGGMILKDVLARVIGEAIFLTPWVLPDAIALTLLGQSLPDAMRLTIFAVPMLTLFCLAIMFWRFNRQEL